MLALLLLVMCCISSSAAQPGSYNDGSGVKPCDAGTFSVAREAGGATSCTKCAEGSISGPGASECIVCPAGMFYVSSSECRHCDAGKYSKMPGSKECLDCAAGYGSSRTSSICTPCPRGSASAGGRACGICPAGSYAANVDDRCAIPRNLFSSFHDPHPSKIVQNEYIYKNIIIKYIFQKYNKKYIFKK